MLHSTRVSPHGGRLPGCLIAAMILFLVAAVLAEPVESGSPRAASPLYLKQSSLEETLLATRRAYAETMPKQDF